MFCSVQVRLKPAYHSKTDFTISLYTHIFSSLEKFVQRIVYKDDCKSEVGINAIPSSSIKIQLMILRATYTHLLKILQNGVLAENKDFCGIN